MGLQRLWKGVAVVGALGLLISSAVGQTTKPPRAKRPPPATKPATPDVPPEEVPETPVDESGEPIATPTAPTPGSQPEARKPPEVGPYIVQEKEKDLLLTIRVHVNSDTPEDRTTYTDPFTGKQVEMPAPRPFEFQTLSMVFPSLLSTASSDSYAGDVKGRLTVNDAPADDTPHVLRGYPGGVRLLRFDANEKLQGTSARQVTLTLELPMRCYELKFDEKLAARVGWPQGPWPEDASSVMKPQLYVETGVDKDGNIRPYEDKIVTEALSKWLSEERIAEPKSVGPVHLAKVITQKVWRDVQIHGEGMSFKRTGELSGMIIRPPDWVLREGRGSPHEAVVVLAAAMRKAGLPTRVVIGYDGGDDDTKFLQKAKKANQIRTWVEFCLYDEANNTVNWVPIDLAELRKSTSKPQAITQNWRYFGNNDKFNMVTPFAFQFHPPTDVVSYGWPGFWGWFVTPLPPEGAEQAVSFMVTPMSTRGGDPPRDPKKKSDR